MNTGEFESANKWEQHPEYSGLNAMLDRGMLEARYHNRLMAEYSGLPEQPTIPPRVEQLFKQGLLIYYLDIMDGVENPDFNQAVEVMTSTLDEEALREVLGGEATEDSLTVDEAQTILTSTIISMKELACPDMDSEESGDTFRLYESARAIAKQNSTTIEAVFKSDELYVEAVSLSTTPEIVISDAKKSLQNLTLESFRETMLSNIMMIAIATGDDEREVQEEISEIRHDPEFISEINQLVIQTKSGMAQLIEHKLIRFWGEEARKFMPNEFRELIVPVPEAEPEEPFVTEIGGMAILGLSSEQVDLLEKREKFVTSYLDEKGWDPVNLTIEQLLEVRAQPGWINPTS